MTVLGDTKRNERRRYIEAERKKGTSWAQIARDCGVSVSAIRQTLQPTVREMFGEGPFICEYCGKSFKYLSMKRSHNYSRTPCKGKDR